MLVDCMPERNAMCDIIAQVGCNKSGAAERIEEGIYLIYHFSFDCMIKNIEKKYPDDLEINPYGVCDEFKQILEKSPSINTSDNKYVISLTPIIKANQPSVGGWRWHKWGPYIGIQIPTCEYIYDEPIIEKVYCYHIYKVY